MKAHRLALLVLSVSALLPVPGQARPRGAGAEEVRLVCPEAAIARSACLIRAALDDLEKTYPDVGGGGITGVRALATNVYRVSVSHEERIVHLAYEFEPGPGGETVLHRRGEQVESMGP